MNLQIRRKMTFSMLWEVERQIHRISTKSIYLHAYGQELYCNAVLLSIIYTVAEYLKGNKNLDSDNQKSMLYTVPGFPLETLSDLFCLLQISLHFLVSVFSRLMKFIIS